MGYSVYRRPILSYKKRLYVRCHESAPKSRYLIKKIYTDSRKRSGAIRHTGLTEHL